MEAARPNFLLRSEIVLGTSLGLSLCFGLADTDEIPFEYFDYHAWRAAKRPKDKSPFFRIAYLKLSPLPACEGRDREAYARDVRAWLANKVAEGKVESDSNRDHGKHAGFLGLEAVLRTRLDQRPKNPKRSRRPYCFGSPELKRVHYEQSVAIDAAHAACSEAYQAGDRTIRFPDGTYPPPIICAAA